MRKRTGKNDAKLQAGGMTRRKFMEASATGVALPWMVVPVSTWGGPASVEFADLVDWTERPEEGIKYYSGKATYTKVFELAEADRRGRIFLDLGEVRNVAEVHPNGKDL